MNEARENHEAIIDTVCYEYNYYKPRMYRKNARNDYLTLAKCRKRSAKKIRKAIKKQLQYVKRDLGHVELLMEQDDIRFTKKQLQRIQTIRELFEQQDYMYRNKVRSVKDRIVSISQPYIRPIVRGKAKAPTEFGAKLDTTTRSSIALSILAMNISHLMAVRFLLYLISIFSRCNRQKNLSENMVLGFAF